MPIHIDPPVRIAKLSFQHSLSSSFIGSSTPSISWRFSGPAQDWTQSSYDIRIDRSTGIESFHIESSQSAYVPWPSSPLQSREIVTVSIKSNGPTSTPWFSSTIEAALLNRSDWTAEMISSPPPSTPVEIPQRPFYISQSFSISSISTARLYATAFGMYDMTINGLPVGTQVLKPGWTSYDHRLYYQVFDVTPLLRVGSNTIRGHVGEGWYSGRLGFLGGKRGIYGERNGLMAQLFMGDEIVVKTDSSWEWSPSPIISSEIYDGEVFDARLASQPLAWCPVEILPPPSATLILDMSPMRRMEEVEAMEIITTPSGKRILDFGQNLVGWIRINQGPSTTTSGSRIVFSHAEVLEDGELGTRPLRIAKCQDTIICDPTTSLDNYEPTFTFHGFRYVQIDGWTDFSLSSISAIVVHTDMERTGWFESSHPLINRLHENVLWGMKGNFVGVPTDCPQRDERLGWTGDLQVFCKTANFLYDTSAMLGGWLQDLAIEQADNDGIPPMVVPDILKRIYPGIASPMAIWGDVAVLGPLDLFEAFGDSTILLEQYESMSSWVMKGIPRAANGLWGSKETTFQLGDWLDPAAPPDFPGDGRTDPMLVADAYLVHVTGQLAKIARILGKTKDALRLSQDHIALRQEYSDLYVSKSGRTVSDSQTALALSLQFDLLSTPQRDVATQRLQELVRHNVFKVATGFAGTPIILDALANNGQLHLAYRMLQEKQCPSWLYCVSMGATTIWERWDSMRPDGSVNPGEMTSFNHYALGAVASFMHKTIGGISPLEPGWRKVLIAPRPGGTVTSAEVKHLGPYGLIRCSWKLEGDKLLVNVSVPPNTSARVEIGDLVEDVGSGDREFVVDYIPDPRWPPKPIYHSMTIPVIDEIA